MAEIKATQCDSCKKILQPKEGLHIVGVITATGDKSISLINNHSSECDLCPLCFWKKMLLEFKIPLKNKISEE